MTFRESLDYKGSLVQVKGYKPPKFGKLLYTSRIGDCRYARIERPDGEQFDVRLRYLRPYQAPK